MALVNHNHTHARRETAMPDEVHRDEAIRHFQRGLVLERAQRIKEAVAEYRQALTRNPGLREAHNALGLYYQRHGLLAKAAEEFRVVVSLEGDFLSYFNLGYVLVDLGRHEEALQAFQRCLSLVPDDAATLFEMGYIHFARGEFDPAITYLQKPLLSYPEDWEIHSLLGNCYLGLRRHEEALDTLARALLLAGTPEAQAAVLSQIATVERHREFRTMDSTKDQIYAQEGVVCLGSAQDDGLRLNELDNYHFTYPDIGTTIQRLLALHQGYRWRVTTIVPLDKASQPLAVALAHALCLPLQQATTVGQNEVALLVLAVAREPELLSLTLERLPCPAITFALGLNWVRPNRPLPELIGVVARNTCSVPWEPELRRLRADGAPASSIDSCLQRATQAILQAISETPLDRNLPRQIRYYTRTHRRLSFPATTTLPTN
jgi:tetratricopeptide (TPR) repeat protein